jgi:hypothetical protein
MPVIEMDGFAAAPSSTPVVEMVGFANRKYRPTVSRLIPNSFAIRRCDHPRSPPVPRSTFAFLKVAGFQTLNFDYCWPGLIDR